MSGIPFSFTAHARDLYLTPQAVIARRVRDAAFVATCTGYNVAYLKGIAPPPAHSNLGTRPVAGPFARFALDRKRVGEQFGCTGGDQLLGHGTLLAGNDEAIGWPSSLAPLS